jgi:hypothetical protein
MLVLQKASVGLPHGTLKRGGKMARNGMYLLVFLVIVGSILVIPSSEVFGSDGCTTYHDSAIMYFPGYGYACAYVGPGCTECVGPGGETCVTDGSKCIPIEHQIP